MTDRELPGTTELKAAAELWKTALAEATLVEDAAWDAGPESCDWRRKSHRTGLLDAVVTTLDEALAKISLIDTADHPIPYSPITPPHAIWPHFDPDVALGDVDVETLVGAQS